MKVILLQDIEHLGRRYDVKDVADGYARNFLLPKKLVKLATPAALREAHAMKKKLEAEAEESLKQAEGLASKLDGYEIHLAEKTNDSGIFFGAIASANVADALNAQGFAVKKEHIVLEEPIKEPGEYPVKLALDHGLEAEIKVIAEAEV